MDTPSRPSMESATKEPPKTEDAGETRRVAAILLHLQNEAGVPLSDRTGPPPYTISKFCADEYRFGCKKESIARCPCTGSLVTAPALHLDSAWHAYCGAVCAEAPGLQLQYRLRRIGPFVQPRLQSSISLQSQQKGTSRRLKENPQLTGSPGAWQLHIDDEPTRYVARSPSSLYVWVWVLDVRMQQTQPESASEPCRILLGLNLVSVHAICKGKRTESND